MSGSARAGGKPAKTSVLVVDDDASLRRVTEYHLEQAGYRVLTAADGLEGVKVFREERPALVITDLQMPGLSGLGVLDQVKALAPETLVIVITAFGTIEQAVDAMKKGAHDFLTKPVSRDALLMVVDKACRLLGLQEENRRLREQLADRVEFSHLVGNSDAMRQVLEIVRRAAPSDATVLLTGESGTGKELVARAIHQASERSSGPFVAVNCAAIPADLLESELFGHVRGAFTGAVSDRAGKFERATGGTLFLDEIGELPAALQPKLLRALQEHEIEPVGGLAKRIDVRVVAATNRDIESAMSTGAFREDLYYRLAVITVELPPLRSRPDDIPLLVRHFLAKHAAAELQVSAAAMALLGRYAWPGNVRELENAIQRMVVLRRGDRLDVDDLPAKIRDEAPGARGATDSVLQLPEAGYSLEALEREAVLQALQRSRWNQSRAAAFLRIPRHVLLYRMEKYGIQKP
ncbi:MAG: sigma-54-dependent Fis family transcriptional regulator [Deltaproteobacteria bacterium]|nr:MAG: sigma-54-dependent Fis family transcriptional regulator [Deltaproteobacteria bacterium]